MSLICSRCLTEKFLPMFFSFFYSNEIVYDLIRETLFKSSISTSIVSNTNKSKKETKEKNKRVKNKKQKTVLVIYNMTLTDNIPSTERNRPTIVSDVIPWDDVIKYINTKELFKLKRSKEQTDRYHRHKDELKEQNMTISQFILQEKLKWDENEIYELNHIKYVTAQQRLNAILTNRQLFKVTLNDFPYNYEPNVLHLLVWSKIKLPIYINDTSDIDNFNTSNNKYPDMNTECERLINKFLSKTLHDKYKLSYGVDYAWFVNYLNLQSIKDLSHIHVLIKWRSEQEKLKMANILIQDGQFRSLSD